MPNQIKSIEALKREAQNQGAEFFIRLKGYLRSTNILFGMRKISAFSSLIISITRNKSSPKRSSWTEITQTSVMP